MEPVKSPREILYETAKSFLGKDASPADEAPDEYGCAETVNEIHPKSIRPADLRARALNRTTLQSDAIGCALSQSDNC